MHATRRPFIGGNWKMNTTRTTAVELARAVAGGVARDAGATARSACDVVIFPPYTFLSAVVEALAGSGIAVGAQDVSPHGDGAYTGQVSATMVRDVGATWSIIGHSERRHGLNESDRLCGEKMRRALESKLAVVFCVGETWEERSAGATDEVNRRQLAAGFDGVPAESLSRVVVAYEPVWAIGTGRTASAADAQAAHRSIREFLASRYDSHAVEGVRILYGGSVNAANASALFSERDVDGGLIGGASLKAADFLAIVAAAQPLPARTGT